MLSNSLLQLYGDRWGCVPSQLVLFCLRQWHPTPVLLPGKSHGRRSLAGCSPRGRYESETTARLHFHFSLSCIGEGNGTPLQCSYLENPRNGGAWWAAIYGVAQSRTRLKQLSSCSSVSHSCLDSGLVCKCLESWEAPQFLDTPWALEQLQHWRGGDLGNVFTCPWGEVVW